jgi:hypothetical protein
MRMAFLNQALSGTTDLSVLTPDGEVPEREDVYGIPGG